MAGFTIIHEGLDNGPLPLFTLDISGSEAVSIYSDTDLQAELIKVLRSKSGIQVFDFEDGLYTRLTVEGNIAFFINGSAAAFRCLK